MGPTASAPSGPSPHMHSWALDPPFAGAARGATQRMLGIGTPASGSARPRSPSTACSLPRCHSCSLPQYVLLTPLVSFLCTACAHLCHPEAKRGGPVRVNQTFNARKGLLKGMYVRL